MKSHKKLIGVLLIILAVGIFLPMHEASALSPCGLATPMARCVEEGVLAVGKIFLNIFALLITGFAYILQGAIWFSQQPSIVAPEVIQQIWGIFRDIANMFFILVLIIMAFGTIFDIHNYTFKDMFVKFLVAALLINFSFTITLYILELANGLSGVFVTQLIDSIGVRFAESLQLAKIAQGVPGTASGVGAATVNQIGNIMPTIITTLLFLVFSIITAGALFAAFLFVIIRIAVIWMLIIVSPIAWFGYTLPSLKAETWDKWWSNFISWAFFLPTYLFFIMIAAMIVGAKKNVGAEVNWDDIAGGSVGEIARLVFGVIGLNDFLFFAIAIFFLIGGIKAAFTVGNFAANGAGTLMNALQGRMKAIPLFGANKIPYVGRFLPKDRALSASDILGGGQALKDTFLREGFPSEGKLSKLKWLYSGKFGQERGVESAKNRFESIFSYRGKGQAAPEKEIEGTKHAQEELKAKLVSGDLKTTDIEGHLDADKVTDLAGNVDTHAAAYFRLAAEQGSLDSDKFNELMEVLRAKNTALATEIATVYVKNVQDKEKLLEIAAPDPASVAGKMFAKPEMANIRKEAARTLISDEGRKGIQKASPAQMKLLLTTTIKDYGETSQITKKFFEDSAKLNPEEVYAFIHDPNNPPVSGFDSTKFPNKATFYEGNWQKNPEKLAGIPVASWRDPDFLAELKNRAPNPTTNANGYQKFKQELRQEIQNYGGTDKVTKLAQLQTALP